MTEIQVLFADSKPAAFVFPLPAAHRNVGKDPCHMWNIHCSSRTQKRGYFQFNSMLHGFSPAQLLLQGAHLRRGYRRCVGWPCRYRSWGPGHRLKTDGHNTDYVLSTFTPGYPIRSNSTCDSGAFCKTSGVLNCASFPPSIQNVPVVSFEGDVIVSL